MIFSLDSYVERPIQLGRLPAFFNPADPSRVIGHGKSKRSAPFCFSVPALIEL
jgi:hypothetical protein